MIRTKPISITAPVRNVELLKVVIGNKKPRFSEVGKFD